MQIFDKGSAIPLVVTQLKLLKPYWDRGRPRPQRDAVAQDLFASLSADEDIRDPSIN